MFAVAARVALLLVLLALGPSQAEVAGVAEEVAKVAEEVAAALHPDKLLDNSSQNKALKPDEWAAESGCRSEQTADGHNGTLAPPECRREPSGWRFNYLFELAEGPFRLLVREGSLDERLANTIYAVSSSAGLNQHSYKFNSGEPAQDLLNERLVAGPQVDGPRCRRQLARMSHLLGQIRLKLGARRNQTGARLELGLDEEHFRLARVLDSFGRFQSGSLAGRYHALGVYQQCLATPLLLDELVATRYCWARMSLDRHLSGSLRRRRRFSQEGDDFQMLVAVCLPASCHSASFSREQPLNGLLANESRALLAGLLASQFELPESLFQERQPELHSVFCLVDAESEWARVPPSGWLLLASAGAWTALLLLATVRRLHYHKQLPGPGAGPRAPGPAGSFLAHLDLVESWLELIGERDPPVRRGPVDLDVLNPIKVVASFAVVLVHAGLQAVPLSREPLAGLAFIESSRLEMLVISGTVLVDTLFVISGILMAYITMRKLAGWERRRRLCSSRHTAGATDAATKAHWPRLRAMLLAGPAAIKPTGGPQPGGQGNGSSRALGFLATWLYVTLHRHLRIVPLFLAVFWFKKGLFNQLGSGPLWDWALNRDTSVGACRHETWLTPLSFWSAFLPLGKQCLPHTWSLANDLFFSLLVPPLIILLTKRPRLAGALAGALILAGSLSGLRAYFAIQPAQRHEAEQGHFHGAMILLTEASHLYTNPFYRIPAILVGILAGHALFRYEQRPAPNWSWSFRWLATPAALLLASCALTMSLRLIGPRAVLGPAGAAYLPAVLLSSYRVVWSLLSAVLLLRVLTDWRANSIMRACSSRFFRVLARLTYALFLIHWDVLTYQMNTRTSEWVFNRAFYVPLAVTTCFWGVPLSVLLYVALENPLNKLTKTYLLRV